MEKKTAFDDDESRSSKSPQSGGRSPSSRRVNAFAADSKDGAKEVTNTTRDEADASGGSGSAGTADAASKPKRNRRTNSDGGGWMNSSSTASPAVDSAVNLEGKGEGAKKKNTNKHFQEEDGDVMIIPDLDEEGGLESDHRIAHAPRNVHRKIPSLAELEAEARAAIATSQEGLSLRPLTSLLVPLSLLEEADEEWNFTSLLTEVTAELSDVPKPTAHSKSAMNSKAKEKDKDKENKKSKAQSGAKEKRSKD